MFWMRNKENSFLIHILIWRPDRPICKKTKQKTQFKCLLSGLYDNQNEKKKNSEIPKQTAPDKAN